ncbi:MAG: acetate--CoA ligase family protein [Candidatus Eisenbacteria bacterium]|uniref:Acetate--CoA ligase family protein n=1 Tax=Eiseniibacteriota bacterium TaxID=2212470 RepID=A0A938BQS3_UNCEI|nr:acetate--CoA ligase family protein [Candidatus Eisenbacteria bacterium]
MTHPRPDIHRLFRPRAIAVIGASHDREKIGFKILQNIVTAGYSGAIHPVNPKGGEILGLPVRASLAEIEGELDVVCTCVPAKHVFDSVRACASRGVKFNLVITSGFSEIGNAEEEKAIVAHAREQGMRILGPNIFGMYSAAAALDMTFGPGGIVPGNVAIITQSGALGLAMIGKTAAENIGISAMVSVGNKADIQESDLLEYLVEDESTLSILMYIEGVRDGGPLVEVLQRAARVKPVVAIKSGRSKRGAAAAASHTGSLAGSDEIFEAIMRQCGVLRAESVREGFDLCKFLARTRTPRGRGTVIITNGGGIGVLATDACEKYGVSLLDDAQDLRATFGPVTPSFGSTRNPIDLTGGATADHYDRALDAALANDSIHSVVALYCETAMFDVATLAPMVAQNYARYQDAGKPIVFSAFGGGDVESTLGRLSRDRVPIFSDVYDAVHCLGGLYRHFENFAHPLRRSDEAPIDLAVVGEILAGARAEGRTFLLAHEGRRLMEAVGIPLPRSRVARTLEEAVRAAEEIGYPVVLKVVSRDILHKSDAGGVALDLENRDEVIDAYQAIYRNCRAAVPAANISGVEVSEMVRKGLELIVGARRDPGFGPIVMFGLGGIYVEVLKDVTFRAVPTSRAEVLTMMKEIRAFPLLMGVRGEERKDIDSVVDAVIRIATLIRSCPGISDIEVNPLVAYEEGEGSKAVDVRVLLAALEEDGTDA